jgi:3-methyladenine DNA glycosylase AlkD/uncharacterized protein YdhG (YjbR/CyaY superfamily)
LKEAMPHKTHDEFLATARADQRAALQKLRKTIKAAAPKAEESISYGLPAFRLNGKHLVAYGAGKNHCSFFPMDSTTVKAFSKELKAYETSKGTIRFQADKPLPAALVRKIVKARIDAMAGGARADSEVDKVLAALKRLASKKIRHDMSARYGIYVDKAWGVRMSDMQKVAKGIGRNHELAQVLWETGWYEARTVASLIDEPERVTPAQMDRWCGDFDNWAICDTVCFKLFDQSPHALKKVPQRARRRDEFQKRAAFALLACVALHNRETADAAFTKCLPLIEQAATDERNFVKKGVSWALRAIGMRSTALNKACAALAERLVESGHAAARWVGKDALRDLNKPALIKRLSAWN